MGRKIRKLNYSKGRVHGIGMFGMLSFFLFQMKKAEDEKRVPYMGNVLTPEYSDPDYPSFWEQYFTRPDLREDDVIEEVNSPKSSQNNQGKAGYIFSNSPNDNFAYLVSWRAVARRHVRLNDSMKAIVGEHVKRLGGERTLGVHFRGTNKFRTESRFISPQTYEKAMLEEAKRGRYKQVFFCTDEVEAYEFFKKRFARYPFKLIFSESFKQKRDCKNNYCDSNFLDSDTISKFDRGKEALVDCFTLGECERLIRHRSNFPSFAIILSDKVKSQRFLVGNEDYRYNIAPKDLGDAR